MLVIKLNNRVEIAKEFAEAIKSDKISKIILFGSVARGEDTEESDIDILIISDYYEEIDQCISDEIYNIICKYQELVSAHVISMERFELTKNWSFLTNVLEDGEILV